MYFIIYQLNISAINVLNVFRAHIVDQLKWIQLKLKKKCKKTVTFKIFKNIMLNISVLDTSILRA